MSVLEEMLTERQKFETQDRQRALKVLTFLIYYEVSFRRGMEEKFMLFRNENDLTSFCTNNEVKVSAMKRLIEELRSEGLIAPEVMPVILTKKGVEELCQ